MGFELSKNTAKKLKVLLGNAHLAGMPEITGTGTGKFDCFVKVTGAKVGDYYPCVTTERNTSTQSWTDYTLSSLCQAPNGEALESGYRYRAVHVGENGGTLYYQVTPSTVGANGCHLDTDADGYQYVTPDTLAGCGLTTEDVSGECTKLAVDFGQLAGSGLEVTDESGCDSLAVKPGCHVEIDETGAVAVTPDTIIGTALVVEPGVSGACDRIGVDLDLYETVALGPYLSELNFSFSGCTMTVTGSRIPVNVNRTIDGIVIGVEEGTPEEINVPINISSVCDCCDGSCGPWEGPGYYCVAGICTYLYNCESWEANGSPTPRYDTSACGDGCGSLSASETGGTVLCGGCEIPDTLYITITSTTGDCGCWAVGPITVTNPGGGTQWSGSISGCGQTITALFDCSGGVYTLYFYYETSPGVGCSTIQTNITSTVTCTPFSASFTQTVQSSGGGSCCTGTVSGTITE